MGDLSAATAPASASSPLPLSPQSPLESPLVLAATTVSPETSSNKSIELQPLLQRPEPVQRIGAFTAINTRDEVIRKNVILGCLLSMAVLAMGVMLIYLRFLLVPLVLAKFLQYVVSPVATWLHSGWRPCPESRCCRPRGPRSRCGWQWRECLFYCRLPHWIAVTLSLLLAVLVITLLGILIALSISQLIQNSDKYTARATDILNKTTTWLEDHDFDVSAAGFFGTGLLMQQHISFATVIVSLTSSLYQLFSDSILLFLFLIYMLYENTKLPMISASNNLRERIDIQIRHYIIGIDVNAHRLNHSKVFISAAVGIVTSAVLFVLKVDLALVIGLLAFLLNFIPNVGPLFALLLPIPMIILDPTKSWSTLLVALAVPGTIHMTVGNFVEPKVLGKTMDLHPITVVVALVFWGYIWGIVGAILSVPITAVFKLWCENVDYPLFQDLARIMGGEQDAPLADRTPQFLPTEHPDFNQDPEFSVTLKPFHAE